MAYTLVTSNKNKLEEFNRFGLSDLAIEKGRDLAEVDSNDMNVILYKALAAGTMRIVEDTSLDVEDAQIGTNIRWLLDNIAEYAGRRAIWTVLLGKNTGTTIEVYKGTIEGYIVNRPVTSSTFGFDNHFMPNGSNHTLEELEQENLKDHYSARKNAIMNLLDNGPIAVYPIDSIPEWTGTYQEA